ncbi:MAG TPA: three-Cys-motif partner protein TcmP, partial [bacterium]
MPERDLHRVPFDAGTIAKLELFKLTAEGVLGVFVGSRQNYRKQIQVFDFFCGPGSDAQGQLGSPLLLLQHLKTLDSIITSNGYRVSIFLNDVDLAKVAALKNKLSETGLDSGPYELRLSNREFSDVFSEEVSRMESAANLVLIDQNGVKQFPPQIFDRLRRLQTTDVMVFMSSSYAWRFQDEPEMQRHLATKKIFEDTPFYDAHRAVVEYFRSLIPVGERYYLAPFSIKKGSNIHGVMFGSSSLKGLEKFLEAAWHLDDRTGEANFDIDREGSFSLPGELPMEWGETKKVQVFHSELSANILGKLLQSTADIYRFALERGF